LDRVAGEANGFHSIFPGAVGAGDRTNSLALVVGGGFNVILSRRIELRAPDADWVRTEFLNAGSNVQNNLRLGAGFVYRLQ
jgi:hypothetical protein